MSLLKDLELLVTVSLLLLNEGIPHFLMWCKLPKIVQIKKKKEKKVTHLFPCWGFTDSCVLRQLHHQALTLTEDEIRTALSHTDVGEMWSRYLKPLLVIRYPGSPGSLAVQEVSSPTFCGDWFCLQSSCSLQHNIIFPAYQNHPRFSWSWLGNNGGYICVGNALRPPALHQHHCNPGAVSQTSPGPGLPPWLQVLFAPVAKGVPRGHRLRCALCHYVRAGASAGWRSEGSEGADPPRDTESSNPHICPRSDSPGHQ